MRTLRFAHRLTTSPAEPSPTLSTADGLRLLLGLLSAVCVLTAACYAQAPPQAAEGQPDVTKIVRDASYNELRSHQGHPFRYRVHTVDNGKDTVKDVIETKDGDISRLIAREGKPLNTKEEQAELERLNTLRDHPEEQARKHKKAQAENDRDDEMLKLLPDAFTYTYLGKVPGPNGSCYRLHFEPNPSFHPPDRQAEVYHGMNGELWVDQSELRMVRFDAHMIEDVDFGWGVVGRLFKGGTIFVEQKDVGESHWENTKTRLNLTGRILMVKALTIQTNEDYSDFAPVPDDGYQAAIALLTGKK